MYERSAPWCTHHERMGHVGGRLIGGFGDTIDQFSRDENYSAARKRVISSQAGSEAESRIDELVLYLEAIGGSKKRKVYGIWSQESQFYCSSASASDTSTASSRP
ncbi:hypothetical protein JCGZ_24116 [Jatropha curcas]|uniref:Uncharacterized protein n=1 Tax=Jatropha curcas TaxID=180498 RepID=A0A067L8V4_JATCU|nr:hypothetical protein JCGZ_24116 [Jatropha curcas]